MAFHRQLTVLRRAAPRGSRASGWTPPGEGAGGHPGRHVALVDRPAPPIARIPVVAAPYTRRNARRRRRDILLALLVAAGTTLVLGAIPALRTLWLVHLAADFLLLAYVGLLVRRRNLTAERGLKVRLLPSARGLEGVRDGQQGRWLEPEPRWLAPEPALLRRSAN